MKQLLQKINSFFLVGLMTTSALFVYASPVSATTGSIFITTDSLNIKPGQQDVPVYSHFNSSGVDDVKSMSCELTHDPTKLIFDTGDENFGSHSNDFVNGFALETSPGSGVVVGTSFNTSAPYVEDASDIEAVVYVYDVDASASGTVTVDAPNFASNCGAEDGMDTAFTTLTFGGSLTFNISGVTVTESGGTTDVAEGGASDTYDVVLDAEPTNPVTIDISTDADVNTNVSSLTFTNANWDTPQTVTVTAQDDGDIEGAHTGTVSMSVNAGSDTLYTGLSVSDVVANVTDDDGLIVEFATATTSANEDTVTYPQITVSGANTIGQGTNSVTINDLGTGSAVVGAGNDYTFGAGTQSITIPEADYTTPQTLDVDSLVILDDSVVEADKDIDFSVTTADPEVSIGSQSTHTYTINDDDGILIEFTNIAASDIEASGGNLPTLTVSGGDISGGPVVTVDIALGGTATGGGDDYSVSTTVTIPAADYSTPSTVSLASEASLSIVDNATVEDNETITMTLNSPSNATVGDADGVNGVETAHTYTITNDDMLDVELSSASASAAEASASGGTNVPDILVNGTSDVATSVQIDITGGTAESGDYALTDLQTVNIPANTYSAGTIAVPLGVSDDMLIEADETVDITLIASASDVQLAEVSGGGLIASHTYTITNDDQLSIEFNDATSSDNEDSGGNLPSLRVGGAVLSSALTLDVTVTGGTATNGDDFSFTSPTQVTILPNDYTTDQAYGIPSLNISSDVELESNETIELGLANFSTGLVSGDADAADGNESTHTYTIVDDDSLDVEFALASSAGDEDAGAGTILINVSGADTTGGSAESVTVNVTGGTAVGGGTDYTFTSSPIAIAPGDYTTTQTVALTGFTVVPNALDDGNRDVEFTIVSGSTGVTLGTQVVHTYTINDDDGLLVEFEDTTANDAEDSGSNLPRLLVSGADTTGSGAEQVDVVFNAGSSTGDGSDYSLSAATVTIPAADYSSGTTPITIPGLSITPDAVVENNETLVFDLTNETSGVNVGNADGADGTEATHTYTITNDDSLEVEFSVAIASDDEDDGGNTPSLLVSGTSAISTSVDIDDAATGSATNGVDYTFSDPTTINIPAATYDGTIGTALAIPLTISADANVEPDETIDLDLIVSGNVSIADVNATDGAVSSHTYTILTDDTDSDNDGVSDAEEAAGPNSGDANGDGTQDSTQSFVSTLVSPVTNDYVTLETSVCVSVTSFDVEAEQAQAAQDGEYSYPVGLNSFTVDCPSNGDTATIKVFYDKMLETSDWVFRKVNSSGEYSTISDVNYDIETVGSTDVTTAEYSVTDGGQLDEDGTENGTIVDPAGPAVLATSDDADSDGDSLEETGRSIVTTLSVAVFLVSMVTLLGRAKNKYAVYRLHR